jgi:ABC-type phosphate/phosphonate transport system substrate-binding protein
MLYDVAMIATLPMYDWPEVREATDRWWGGISRHLRIDVVLSRIDRYADAWTRDDLLFSQTCGYPFTHALADRVRLLATPHYAVDGCDGPRYQSLILAREKAPLEKFRGATAAVNAPESMSGMLALKLVFAHLAVQGKFFGKAIETGSHIGSMGAVRDGLADICAIDAVCVAMARRFRPDYLEGLVEVARSPMVPGLPYINTAGDVTTIRDALGRAFADPDLQEARDHLFLSGVSLLKPQDYYEINQLEAAMERAGGMELL